MRWFWQRQADELQRRAQIKDLHNSLPTRSLAPNDGAGPTEKEYFAAADAVALNWQNEQSVHQLFMGNPNSDIVRMIRWADMLRAANAGGAERMVVLDAAAPGGVHVDVDVKLSMFAAELDVLDALAPGLRRPELVDQVKEHLHRQALQAMADKDAR